MQIGIEDICSTSGEWKSVDAKVTVVANGRETKVIAKYIDKLQEIGNDIVKELYSESNAKN